jgi:hypothetical protein
VHRCQRGFREDSLSEDRGQEFQEVAQHFEGSQKSRRILRQLRGARMRQIRKHFGQLSGPRGNQLYLKPEHQLNLKPEHLMKLFLKPEH